MVLTFSYGRESSRGSFITLDPTSVSACQRRLIKEDSLSADSVHECAHAGRTHVAIPDGLMQLLVAGMEAEE